MLTFGRSLRKTTILYVNFWILFFFFSMGAALSKVRFFMLQGAQWKKLTWIGED